MKDPDIELVKIAVDQLSEHFDAVTVFASRHEPELEDGTIAVMRGAGNWFARYGQVRDWLTKEEERMRKAIRVDDE